MPINNKLYTEFKINLNPRPPFLTSANAFPPDILPEFCKDTCFNYFSSGSGQGEISPKRYDTRVLYINNSSKIFTLSVKNYFISYWSDVWYNEKKEVVDPEIVRVDLKNNKLSSFIVEEERKNLQYLDLSGNRELTELYIPLMPELTILKLNNMDGLLTALVSSPVSPKLSRLEMKNTVINPNIISQMSFSGEPGLLDFTGSEVNFSENDLEVLDYLSLTGYTILQD